MDFIRPACRLFHSRWMNAMLLLEGVARAASSLWQVPDDILKRAFQIARFTVKTITEVDPYPVMLQLIDAGRTEHRARSFVI